MNVGSNVIIGAHSVVTKDIPDNVVVAGNPTKIICSIDDYYQKKKKNQIADAVMRARHIKDTKSRVPTVEDMAWFNVLWFDRTPENEKFLRKLPFRNAEMNDIINTFYSTKQVYNSFDDFLKEALNL